MVKHKEINKYDYYICERCEINSETKGRMCPCPRGSCEAVPVGKMKVTLVKEITLKRGVKKNQKKIVTFS
jgi:hypothetical protein